MNEKEALNYIIYCLKEKSLLKPEPYGYDVYLHSIISHYVENAEKRLGAKAKDRAKEVYPCFYAAAWTLCHRGILRYGVGMPSDKSVPGRISATGYTVTQFAKAWVVESCCEDMVPTQPELFAETLKSFGSMMDLGFYERAQKALDCYREHVYSACCAMCGSAAESIMLALAISMQGVKQETMKIFGNPDGRSKIENLILEKKEKPVQEEFLAYATLLMHWREEISQERLSCITQDEAYIALAMIVSFAKFAKSHWNDELETANADNPNRIARVIRRSKKIPGPEHSSPQVTL